MSKIDWVAIRQDYVTGNSSQRELAKKYKVSESIVADKSSKENWPMLRGEYQAELEQEAQNIQFTNKAEYLANRNQNRANVWRSMQKLVTNEIEVIVDLQEQGKQINVTKLKSLSQTLSEAIKGERLEEGQPPVIEKLEIQNMNSMQAENQNQPRHTLEELEEAAVNIVDLIAAKREKML